MNINATPDVGHYDGQDLEALADMPNYTTALLEPMRAHLRGRVIEVGAGIGNVSKHYIDGVERALLVEPANNLYERLQERFSGDGHVETTCAALEEVDADLLADPFDAAVLVNVLEHIPDDRATVERLHTLLRPGGALLLFVPAHPWLYGSLDELVHHCRRYTRSGLRDLVEQAGFEIETLHFFDCLGVVPWFVVGRVLRRRRFDDAGVRLYDRFGVPLTGLLEGLIVPPFGKSLLCIAQKPAT